MNGLTKKKAASASSFSLPADFDSNRYELWTVRLPSQINAKELDETTISLEEPTTIVSKGQSYSLHISNTRETESFRLLLPKKKDEDVDDAVGSDSDSSDSDADSKEKKTNGNSTPANQELQPFTSSFQRHLIVTSTLRPHEELSTESVAPKVNVRRAYAHVPQKTGLKRRWAPIGGAVVPVASVVVESAPADSKLPAKRLRTGKADDVERASSDTTPAVAAKQRPDKTFASDSEDSTDSQRRKLAKKERKESKNGKRKKDEKKAKKHKKNVNK